MKYKIAVVGGSMREEIVYNALKEKGYDVFSYGIKTENQKPITLEECLKDAKVLILPVRSNHKDMLLEGRTGTHPIKLSEDLLRLLADDAVIYCGAASQKLRDAAKESGHALTEIMEINSVAIPNAILTAEGTLKRIMEISPKSLDQINVVVLGFGRVGEACAEVFQKTGMKVSVLCRDPEGIAKGRENGLDMRYFEGAYSVLSKADFAVNSVPALIMDEKMVSYMRKGGHIIDLASLPGGVDFDAAEKFGIVAEHLLGVPGTYAPVSAGKILATYYLAEIPKIRGGEMQ